GRAGRADGRAAARRRGCVGLPGDRRRGAGQRRAERALWRGDAAAARRVFRDVHAGAGRSLLGAGEKRHVPLSDRRGRRAADLVGLGALMVALLPGGGGVSVYQGIGVAVLVSVALSVLSGAVTLRLRGVYFAMFTLALAEVFWVLAKSGTFHYLTGAEDGLPF